MRTLEESRKYEVKMPDGSWQLVHWEQLDVGDIARCFPPLFTDIYHVGEPFEVVEQPGLRADTIVDQVQELQSEFEVKEHPHLLVDKLEAEAHRSKRYLWLRDRATHEDWQRLIERRTTGLAVDRYIDVALLDENRK